MSKISGRRSLRMPGLNSKQFRTVRKLVDKDLVVNTVTNLFSNTTISTTAQYFDLTGSITGTNKTVHLYRMEVSIGLDDNSTTAQRQAVRIVIGRNRNGGVISSGFGMTTNPSSENVFILFDRMYYIGEYQTEPIRIFKTFKFRNKKIPHLNCKVSSSASVDNQLFCMMISDAGSNPAQCKLFCKFVYRDDTITPT